MEAREVIKRLDDEFVPALEILRCIEGGEAERLTDGGNYVHPASFKFFCLLNQENDAPAWYVWRRLAGVRRAYAKEKEEGVNLVLAFTCYDNNGISEYITRNKLNEFIDDEDAIFIFEHWGEQQTNHGFLRSEIVPFLTKHGLGNDNLNDLIAPAHAAQPATKPGKEPRNLIGQLATNAAWEIERETGQRATSKATMTRLMEWAASGDHSDLRPDSKGRPLAVEWVTGTGGCKPYELDTLAKALERWRKSRQ